MESTVHNAQEIIEKRNEEAKKKLLLYVEKEIAAINAAIEAMYQESMIRMIIPGMGFHVWSDKAHEYAREHGFYIDTNTNELCIILPKEE